MHVLGCNNICAAFKKVDLLTQICILKYLSRHRYYVATDKVKNVIIYLYFIIFHSCCMYKPMILYYFLVNLTMLMLPLENARKYNDRTMVACLRGKT